MNKTNYRTEFHIHTKASSDSLLGKHALLHMCRAKHLNCIAITDHNEVSGALDFRSFLEPHGVDVIVGEEVFTSEGEIVGLWLEERIEPGLSPERTVAEIKRQGGIVYIPHPYDSKREKTVIHPNALLRIAHEVDCVEVHNGRNISEGFDCRQQKAYESVREINRFVLPVIGCDAHAFFEIGRNFVVTDTPFSRENFHAVLKDAHFEPSACIEFSHTTTKLVRLLKMLRKRDFDGIRGVLHRKLAR